MNVSKIILAAILASSSLAIACSGSDEGKSTDSSGTEGRRSSRSDDDDDRDSRDRSSNDSNDSDDESSSQQQTQECRGSSLCINGSCKCESGPQKGKSCCYAPEEEDDPPCAKANECDNVCNSCD
jgi:hypothetical protein